jgi:restriction endonuclease Mrr
MPYKSDHIKVLKALAVELPKRAKLATSEIVSKSFKGQEDADRRVRNAFRMLRKYKHVDIVDRGLYQLTDTGKNFYEKLAANNFKAPEMPKVKTEKKATPAKKETKPAPKKTAPKKAKPAPKKAAPKKAAKPIHKKTTPTAKANGSNGKSAKPAEKSAPKSEAKPAAPAPKPAPKADEKKSSAQLDL